MNDPCEFQFTIKKAGYHGKDILSNESGGLSRGEWIGLIGPNGCGKSTLLKALANVISTEGSVTKHSPSGVHKAPNIGFVFQTNNTFPSLTVDENLSVAYNGHRSSLRQRKDQVVSSFEILEPLMTRRAGLLSGGERQALAVALVLMNSPEVLLLDEPLAGLSPATAPKLLSSIRKIATDENMATIIVEHRLNLIRHYIEKVWIMRRGTIVHRSDDPSILENPGSLSRHYQLV